MASRHLYRGATFVVLASFAGCTAGPSPTCNPWQLQAIAAESRRLIATYPVAPEGRAVVPESEWPPAVAHLQPYSVTVHTWGVDIGTRPFFDGGWGYEIPRDKRELPMPLGCYSELAQGVFWHGPC